MRVEGFRVLSEILGCLRRVEGPEGLGIGVGFRVGFGV